jgi:predicted nucleotidyltransferase
LSKQDILIKDVLQQYCKEVIKRFKPVCIILYGSRAKGTFTDKSDVDIIVISSNFNQDFLSRIKNLIDANTTMLPH